MKQKGGALRKTQKLFSESKKKNNRVKSSKEKVKTEVAVRIALGI